MAEIFSNPLPSETFDWKKGNGVAEASDFGGRFRFHQIYNDAADIGITVKSERTGLSVNYYMDTEHERGGDITHWTLKPTPETVRRQPQLRGTELTVFND